MTSRQQHVRAVYSDLVDKAGSPGQRVRIRIDRNSPIPVYAGCIFPHKNVALEIGPIRNAWLPQGCMIPKVKGLGIELKTSEHNPEAGASLILELQKPDAFDIYLVLVMRVCEELDLLDKPEDAVKSVIALVGKWKEFFSGFLGILGEGRQTGLYGELYMAHLLCKKDIPLSNVIRAWTGSKKTNQDFEFGDTAIEVKSTVAVDATFVNITNSRQLDDSGLEKLFLARVVLDVRQGDEHTLPKLIESIRASIEASAPDVELDFEEKLLDAGYLDRDKDHYSGRSYSERMIVPYEIKDGFPRLLESDLPIGVTKVSYELALAACAKYVVGFDCLASFVRKSCD